MSTFYKLSSTTMDPCTMAKAFRGEARRNWLCAGCGNPREQRPIDLLIQEERPDNTPLNGVTGCTIGIARKDFLFSFGEELVRQHLYLGQVFGPDKCPMESWITFVGRHRIIVRGSKNVTSRRCSECGKNVYFAMGQNYLYPEPPPGASILDAGFGGLVVTHDLVGRIDLNAWQKLNCMKLPVLDVPKDGLHELKG